MLSRNIPYQPEQVIDPKILLRAYATGYFPMADARDGEIYWYSPDPRAIIPLETFKTTRSLRQTLRKRVYEIRINTSFETVMRDCAARSETWISEEIVQSYLALFRMGFAHSVEAWREGALAGGLYGVTVGAAFFGESMFSRRRDASKVALVALVERLRTLNFELLDTQFTTPHLLQFGAVEIPRDEYLVRLKSAIRTQLAFFY